MPLEASSRRKFIKAATASGIVGLAGCTQGEDEPSPGDEDQDGSDQTDTGERTFPVADNPDDFEKLEYDFHGVTRDISSQRFSMAEVAIKMWEDELGFTVNHVPQSFSSIAEKFLQREFNVLALWYSARTERLDPTVLLYNVLHSDFSPPGNQNASGFENEEFDRYADKVRTTFDREERRQAAFKCQEILAEQTPAVFVFHVAQLTSSDTRAWQNWNAIPGGMPYWNVFSWSQLEEGSNQTDTFILGTTRPIERWNTYSLDASTSVRAMKPIYDPLVRLDLNGQPKPSAAEEINVVDETTIDVDLREGMTFHDGEPVSADDVKFTYDSLQKWDSPYIKPFYGNIDSTEKLGQNAIRFNLIEPEASFVSVSLNQTWILPKHVWEGVTERENLSHPGEWPKNEVDMTGSGPFKRTQYDSQSRTVYEKHENFEETHPWSFPMDKLVWKVYGNKSAAIGDLENGSIHNVKALGPSQFNRLKDNSNLDTKGISGHGVTMIHLNNRRKPFDDRPLRLALSNALDKQELVNIALQGQGDIAKSSIAPANDFYHNPDVPAQSGNPDRARQLLIDAGYRWDENGNLMAPKSKLS